MVEAYEEGRRLYIEILFFFIGKEQPARAATEAGIANAHSPEFRFTFALTACRGRNKDGALQTAIRWFVR